MIAMRTWQYNGVAPWWEIVKWCDDNLDTRWVYNNSQETIFFELEKDYTVFLLRWS